METLKIHPLWLDWLSEDLSSSYFKELLGKIQVASTNETLYPPKDLRYTALQSSPEDIRVVILGQDPYHGEGQAHGLSFSVLPGVKIPPSLRNIYLEIEKEGLGQSQGRDGYLLPWANQGVLLLNNVLTVKAGDPGSCKGWGWERFTDSIIRELATRRKDLVFLLWGADAATKADGVDPNRHLVLKSPHPSPFSAYRGFLGNGHFKKANDWLIDHKKSPIQW